MSDWGVWEPALNSSFSIVVCIYLLRERAIFNEKIIRTMQDITTTLGFMKEELGRLRP